MKSGRWIIALGLVAGLGACSGDAGQSEGMAGEEPEQSVLVAPACAPSERMPVEGRPSPYDSATIELGEGVAKICYGRPALKGRTMLGGAAVPYDTLWRTGANEPTTIHLNVPATIAGMEVEPGSYSLYTVPREGDTWTLIVNRSTSQWGHESNYTDDVRAQEVGRADVTAESIEERIELLTIRPLEDGSGAALEWQSTRVRIPIEAR